MTIDPTKNVSSTKDTNNPDSTSVIFKKNIDKESISFDFFFKTMISGTAAYHLITQDNTKEFLTENIHVVIKYINQPLFSFDLNEYSKLLDNTGVAEPDENGILTLGELTVEIEDILNDNEETNDIIESSMKIFLNFLIGVKKTK